MDDRSRFRGCLLGGAVGDALGGAVEFMRLTQIRKRFGAGGIRTYAEAYGQLGAITDDTQMTLFTAEGLIRGLVRERHNGSADYPSVTANANVRWLLTQGSKNNHGLNPVGEAPGWLYTVDALHSQRAPGRTCLSALQDARQPGLRAENDSKGCGGVMRVAPVGLFAQSIGESFELGCELAALTHGHPTGWLTGGALAVMIACLRRGDSLPGAIDIALDHLSRQADHHETSNALRQTVELAGSDLHPDEAIAQLGQGWIAEEALAVAVYCALVAPDFREGVVMAVNHDGDSDSTGAIAGNLLGVIVGDQGIPAEWLGPLEMRAVITEMADDLLECRDWSIGPSAKELAFNERILLKYPGY